MRFFLPFNVRRQWRPVHIGFNRQSSEILLVSSFVCSLELWTYLIYGTAVNHIT